MSVLVKVVVGENTNNGGTDDVFVPCCFKLSSCCY